MNNDKDKEIIKDLSEEKLEKIEKSLGWIEEDIIGFRKMIMTKLNEQPESVKNDFYRLLNKMYITKNYEEKFDYLRSALYLIGAYKKGYGGKKDEGKTI